MSNREIYRDQHTIKGYGIEYQGVKHPPANPSYIELIVQLVEYTKDIRVLYETLGKSHDNGIMNWFERNISYLEYKRAQTRREHYFRQKINQHRRAVSLDPYYPE